MQNPTQESALASELEQVPSTPVAPVRGVLKVNHRTGEVFFHSETGRKYYTLSEYHKWAGMACVAEIAFDQSIEAANIGGCAYRIVLIDELPNPSELEDAARYNKKKTRYFYGFSLALMTFIWFVLLPVSQKHQAELDEWVRGAYQQEAVEFTSESNE